ncbi:hypothetical protein [Calothrix sp. NIES-2098]|uniref:hypothetical protein n=1 Tax=Calothrix sp. NIES-2098 TaxID=1954171 RepID=UPI000B6044A2|nr:hypothetical protein NIES2098_07800 [Calothrix sp. NIES-2098]
MMKKHHAVILTAIATLGIFASSTLPLKASAQELSDSETQELNQALQELNQALQELNQSLEASQQPSQPQTNLNSPRPATKPQQTSKGKQCRTVLQPRTFLGNGGLYGAPSVTFQTYTVPVKVCK